MPTLKDQAETARKLLRIYKTIKDEFDVDMNNPAEVIEASTDLICDLSHLFNRHDVWMDDMVQLANQKYADDMRQATDNDIYPAPDYSQGKAFMSNINQISGMGVAGVAQIVFGSDHPLIGHLSTKLEKACKGSICTAEGFVSFYTKLDSKNRATADEWLSVERL